MQDIGQLHQICMALTSPETFFGNADAHIFAYGNTDKATGQILYISGGLGRRLRLTETIARQQRRLLSELQFNGRGGLERFARHGTPRAMNELCGFRTKSTQQGARNARAGPSIVAAGGSAR